MKTSARHSKTGNLRHCLVLLGVLLLTQGMLCTEFKSKSFTISLQGDPYLVTGEQVEQDYKQRKSLLKDASTYRFGCEENDDHNCELWGKKAYANIPSEADKYIGVDLHSQRSFVEAFRNYALVDIFNCGVPYEERSYVKSIKLVGESEYHLTMYIPLPQHRGVIKVEAEKRKGVAIIPNRPKSLCISSIGYALKNADYESNMVEIPVKKLQPVIDEYDCGLPSDIRDDLTSDRDYTEACSSSQTGSSVKEHGQSGSSATAVGPL